MTRAARQRLYFALWPDAPLRAAIASVAAESVAAVAGRAVPNADLHVTLAFLGELPAERAADAAAAARSVRAAPGAQTFDRIGTWARGGPLVLAGTRTAPALDALRSTLANALLGAGFALDRRRFRPHITLARAAVRRCAPRAVHVEWRYAGFVLVESRLGPGGSRYRVIESFPPD